jgi:hypothetical protein
VSEPQRIQDAPEAAALLYAFHLPQVSLEGHFRRGFVPAMKFGEKTPPFALDTKRRGRNREEAFTDRVESIPSFSLCQLFFQKNSLFFLNIISL